VKARQRAALAALVPLVFLAACGSDSDDAADADPIASEPDATAAPAPGSTASSDASTPADSGEGGSLTLYSGRNEELVDPLIAEFEAATGIDVEVRYGSSAEMGAALMEEGEASPADVFFSQEVGALGVLAKADLLTPLPDEVVEQVDERFRPLDGNPWVGVTGRSRVIVYNKDLVADPPEGVMELTDPAYEGQVAIVPGNAGFQAFVTGFRVSEGEDAAREWLEGMIANDAVTNIESNDDVLTAVENGDIPMGLINHYYWARSLDEAGGAANRAAQLVFPGGDDPGGLVNATAAGITVNGADNPAALAFVEYLLSEAGQTYFATETYEYPVVDGVADPVGIPPLDELEGPPIDLTDLDSLEATQALLTELGLLS
jgi:iron(III) transport system substrate-binding protein